MNDTLRWVLFGIAAVVLVGLTVLRIGMRGNGRGGAYLVIRIIVAVVVLGILAWRYWTSTHH
jgi:hypothetical protein